ncbi:hypothetical protein Acr_00g0010880 [Actinidia rufa]|uniref:Uncharacterized protein n=1 Tax=Actinidia rufa TaxID=165716 RepID=A0A7J0D9H2_9ERIC|nr:hypothetical protein Acr_00g0010880 [Actinidia rufa]
MQMACHASSYLKTTSLFIILVVFGFRENLAMRPLEGEKWMHTNRVLAAQILQKGSVPSSHGNPCTNIPGGKPERRCTLAENEVNFFRPSWSFFSSFPGCYGQACTRDCKRS